MRCSNIGFFLWFKIRHNIIILMINFVGMTNKGHLLFIYI